MAGWSSTVNATLSFMFEYLLKPKERENCLWRDKKYIYIKIKEICTCVECLSIISKGRQLQEQMRGLFNRKRSEGHFVYYYFINGKRNSGGWAVQYF